MAWVCILAAISAGALRGLAIWLNRDWFRQGFVGDSSVHFCLIRQFQEKFSSRKVDQFVIPNTMSYPVLFHQVCALFPEKIIKEKSWLPNWILSIVTASLFGAYVFYLETQVFQTVGYWTTGIALVTFFISTSNWVFHGPAIAYIKLSSRLLGRVCSAFHYFPLVMYLIHGDPVSLVIAVLGCSLTLASSTFGAQLAIFSTPLLALVYLDWVPFLVLLGGLVLSLGISGGRSWISLTHMVRYWEIYHQFVKQSRQAAPALSHWLNPRIVFRALSKGDFKGLIRELSTAEPTRALLFYPEFFLFAILIAMTPKNIALTMILPLVPIALIYMLTTTRGGNHFGESYRYFEYGLYLYLPFAIALAASKVANYAAAGIAIGCYLIWVLVLAFVVQWKRPSYPQGDVLDEFLQKLDLKHNNVVFPVTMRLGADICARTSCQTFWWQPGGITCPEQYKKFIEEYPFLKRDWKQLAEEFGVTHIVCENAALESASWTYDFSDVETILNDGKYVAFRVDT